MSLSSLSVEEENNCSDSSSSVLCSNRALAAAVRFFLRLGRGCFLAAGFLSSMTSVGEAETLIEEVRMRELRYLVKRLGRVSHLLRLTMTKIYY